MSKKYLTLPLILDIIFVSNYLYKNNQNLSRTTQFIKYCLAYARFPKISAIFSYNSNITKKLLKLLKKKTSHIFFSDSILLPNGVHYQVPLSFA